MVATSDMLEAVEKSMRFYDKLYDDLLENACTELEARTRYRRRKCPYCPASRDNCGVCLIASVEDGWRRSCLLQPEWGRLHRALEYGGEITIKRYMRLLRKKQRYLIKMIGRNGYNVVEVNDD